jgi:hypothetical protein
MLVPLTISVWRFNTILKRDIKEWIQIFHLILYKIEAVSGDIHHTRRNTKKQPTEKQEQHE